MAQLLFITLSKPFRIIPEREPESVAYDGQGHYRMSSELNIRINRRLVLTRSRPT